jgi:hypothetical protein
MSRMTPELHGRIEQMLADGHPHRVIASETGVTLRVVSKVSCGGYFNRGHEAIGAVRRAAIALKTPRQHGGRNAAHADPTTEEIADACQRLRALRVDADADADGWLPPGACRVLTVTR